MFEKLMRKKNVRRAGVHKLFGTETLG